MDKIEEGLNVILSSVIGNIPSADWENASLNVCALNKIISMRSFYEETGNFISFDPEENGVDVTMRLKKLREDMYAMSPNKGAWYTAMFTVNSNGKFDSVFDYNNKPDFKYEPGDDKYIDDLEVFPREDNLIPDWLKEICD